MSSPPVTQEEIQSYIQLIATYEPIDHKLILYGIGNYFYKVLPTDVDDSYIEDVQVLLNGLYLKADEFDWQSTEGLLEALSIAAELVDNIRSSSGKSRKREFFKAVKQLGNALLLISKSDFDWES